ncbi:hypothetical protein RF679_13755 [Undibacterium cyanobacteriorum]|uniref:Uncharacterized protein n=1 Tax=Undibacterium cyanobacteriorum TaxID=3073561 RepID=A0ABY9RFJ1_9BURK|nr:hypothetical protein [Undibacterium sp. 20NA77.5]WMW79711.1 hypothetical protein RF679_13755 [Undibacterium sp. 20NA77.5]
MRIISNDEIKSISGGAIFNPNGRPTKIVAVQVPVYDALGNVAYSNVEYVEVFDVEAEAAREQAAAVAKLTLIYMEELRKLLPNCENTVNTVGDSQTKSATGTASGTPSVSGTGSVTSQLPATGTRCPPTH